MNHGIPAPNNVKRSECKSPQRRTNTCLSDDTASGRFGDVWYTSPLEMDIIAFNRKKSFISVSCRTMKTLLGGQSLIIPSGERPDLGSEGRRTGDRDQI